MEIEEQELSKLIHQILDFNTILLSGKATTQDFKEIRDFAVKYFNKFKSNSKTNEYI